MNLPSTQLTSHVTFIMKSPKITPFLWFNKDAEKAAEFYTTLFPNSKIISNSPFISTIDIDGQRVSLMNAGGQFPQTEAFSFHISCKDQKEVDYYWNGFVNSGGKESQCGWIKDKWGVSWQVVPQALVKMNQSGESAKIQKMTEAMMKMSKLVVKDLEKAFNSL